MNNLLSQNPYILFPFSVGILLLIIGYIKLWQLRKTEQPGTVLIFWVWLLGLVALVLGMIGQVFMMREAFDAIEVSGDFSPDIVASAIKNSYNPTLIGLLVLFISLLAWGLLNHIKRKKMAANKIELELEVLGKKKTTI